MKVIRLYSHYLQLEPADGLEWDFARDLRKKFRL